MPVPALRVQQWLPDWNAVRWDAARRQSEPSRKHYYVLSLSARLLKRLSGIQRRSVTTNVPRAEDIGIQRFHDRDRSAEIREYVRYGYPWSDLPAKRRASPEFADLQKPGWLPTAIIVNIPGEGATRRDLTLDTRDAIAVLDKDDGIAELQIPAAAAQADWTPIGLHPLEVIDGQHRLWAFEDTGSLDVELPVVAFFDLDISWQAYLFWSINIKPKRINASLAFDLYPLLRSEDWLDKFVGHPIYRETRAQELVEALWAHPRSPWVRRINMLGESAKQSGDDRPMVSQSAWIRSLLATYVKAWEGRGVSIGGLFGAAAGQHETVLPWTRTQQAAFLINVWETVYRAVRNCTEDWAINLRSHAPGSTQAAGNDDPAFYSKYSLFTTDPGVRGVLAVTNDLCWLRRDSLDLPHWRAPDAATALDVDAMSAALDSLSRLSVASYLEAIATALTKYDWRSSSTPGLDPLSQRAKRALRGSGGYKQLRTDLLTQLSNEHGDIGKTARDALQLIG